MRPTFIAEIKKKSPYGFRSKRTWGDLCKLAIEHGDWVSVHTDHRWGGHWNDLITVRERTDKPILAKGIHSLDSEIEKAFSLGADYVLCVGRVPNKVLEYDPWWIDRVIIEPNCSLFDRMHVPYPTVKICANSRDVHSGGRVTGAVECWTKFSRWICQASNIKTPADLVDGISAFIVGEHLETFVEEYNK